MTQTFSASPEQEARRRRTVLWVVGLATVGLVFDGYDLVVYGTVVSTFLRDPTQIGVVTPGAGGRAGQLRAGRRPGRRAARRQRRRHPRPAQGDAVRLRLVLGRHGAHRADDQRTTTFGLLRFVTGLGVGALVATTGALVSEFAPPGKKNLVQRDHLLRRAARQPARGPAGHHPAGRHRLARHVLDRGAAAGHPAAAGLLQDAGVGGLAARPAAGSTRRGRISERTGVPLSETPPPAAAEPGGSASGSGSPGCSAAEYLCADRPAGPDERHGSAAGLLAQHLAAGADAARRVQRQGLAVVPAGAQRRRRDRCAHRLPGRRPVRPETGRRQLLPARRGRHRAAHAQPAARPAADLRRRRRAWAPAAPRR